jgi:hypothetical protein
VFKKNISDGAGSKNKSIDTPLDPPLFWLDNIFKRKLRLSAIQVKIEKAGIYVGTVVSVSCCCGALHDSNASAP